MADTPNAPDTPTHTLSAVPSRIASGAATPVSLPPLDDEQRSKSIMVSLADLTAKANALYAQQKYEDATEIFAQAAEMQAEFNGEMSPENANVLFLYGRSLFRVGQSKSDVLGGKAATEKKSKPKPKPKASGAAASSSADAAPAAKAQDNNEGDRIAEEGVAIVAKEASGVKEDADKLPDDKKPLFQFTGDENWEGSDDEDEAEGEGEGEDEDEDDDDLAVAFEVLDLARVLFEKSLEAAESEPTEGKGKEVAEGDSPSVKHIKERLGDTHDLLAEISLENEKYPEAIKDSRASLKYKSDLYPLESEIIAEAHFKLSLALEFASITSSGSEEGGEDAGPKQIDQGLRDEAASELEKAIESTKLKLKNKEVELAMMHVPEENEETRKTIADVKDMIADMEQRLVDLRKPPVDVDSMLGADNPMSGILGAALGESSSETAARVEAAKKNATDLSGLVRKKAKKEEEEEEPSADANGAGSKRKADDEPAAADHESPKKARVEDNDGAAAEPAEAAES